MDHGRLEGQVLAMLRQQRVDFLERRAAAGGQHQFLRVMVDDPGMVGHQQIIHDRRCSEPLAAQRPPRLAARPEDGQLAPFCAGTTHRLRQEFRLLIRHRTLLPSGASEPLHLGKGQFAAVDMHAAHFGAAA